MESPFFTVEEACSYVRCKRTKLFSLCSQGRLERRKLDSKTLITVESVKRLVSAPSDGGPCNGRS